MPLKLVIFDLDGTVLNTLDDLLDAMNATLSASGYPGHTLEEMRGYIGDGLKMMAKRALPEGSPESLIEEVYTRFRRCYSERLNIKTAPYPGIVELLRALKRRGLHIAVSTNKFDPGAQRLIKAHFGDLVDYTLGETEGLPRKPDPAGPARILAHFGVTANEAVYVGDSDVDVLTARNLGALSAGVLWGFQDEARLRQAGCGLIAADPAALKEILINI